MFPHLSEILSLVPNVAERVFFLPGCSADTTLTPIPQKKRKTVEKSFHLGHSCSVLSPPSLHPPPVTLNLTFLFDPPHSIHTYLFTPFFIPFLSNVHIIVAPLCPILRQETRWMLKAHLSFV